MLDLFSGRRGWSAAWRRRGHEVFSVDIDRYHTADLYKDVRRLSPGDIPWQPDIIVASPPCEHFSVAKIGRYWGGALSPFTQDAMDNVSATVKLIDELEPTWWVIENPVGMLRKLDLIPYERYTTTLCRYGAGRMKPTDLWGRLPMTPRISCRNGEWCHPPAPRGSRQGTQSLYSDWSMKAEIPYALSLELLRAATRRRP